MDIRNQGGVFQRRALAIALICVNQFQPCLALAGQDGPCPSRYDTDCNGLVDGADLARVLADWGTSSNSSDFNGDCLVGSADLGQLLAAWGTVDEPSGGDHTVFFQDREVSICLGDGVGTVSAVINGFYTPGGFNGFGGGYGDGTGELEVVLDGSVVSQIVIGPSGIMAFGFDCKLGMSQDQDVNMMSVNGMDRAVADVIDEGVADIHKHGAMVVDWDCYTAMMMSMTMVMNVPEMAPVVQNEPSAWCKVFAIGVGFAITVAMGSGCVTFTAGCAVGTTATYGGLTLPCSLWVGLCFGGVYAGSQAAYELALGYCN